MPFDIDELTLLNRINNKMVRPTTIPQTLDELQIEQAVISMLAGDVFDNPAVLRRLRLFRLIYAFNTVAMAPQALRDWWRRRRTRRVGFSGETLQTEDA